MAQRPPFPSPIIPIVGKKATWDDIPDLTHADVTQVCNGITAQLKDIPQEVVLNHGTMTQVPLVLFFGLVKKLNIQLAVDKMSAEDVEWAGQAGIAFGKVMGNMTHIIQSEQVQEMLSVTQAGNKKELSEEEKAAPWRSFISRPLRHNFPIDPNDRACLGVFEEAWEMAASSRGYKVWIGCDFIDPTGWMFSVFGYNRHDSIMNQSFARRADAVLAALQWEAEMGDMTPKINSSQE